MRNEMAGKSASRTAQEPMRFFVKHTCTRTGRSLVLFLCECCLFGKWKVVQSHLWFTAGKVVSTSCFEMSATSEESMKKDDSDGRSVSDGDVFDKIRSLFGDAICAALQSKLYKFLFIRQACMESLSFKISNIRQCILNFFVGHFWQPCSS